MFVLPKVFAVNILTLKKRPTRERFLPMLMKFKYEPNHTRGTTSKSHLSAINLVFVFL